MCHCPMKQKMRGHFLFDHLKAAKRMWRSQQQTWKKCQFCKHSTHTHTPTHLYSKRRSRRKTCCTTHSTTVLYCVSTIGCRVFLNTFSWTASRCRNTGGKPENGRVYARLMSPRASEVNLKSRVATAQQQIKAKTRWHLCFHLGSVAQPQGFCNMTAASLLTEAVIKCFKND